MKMKNLIIGLLAGLSAFALLFIVLTSEKTTQYEPSDTKTVAEKGYKDAVEWAHSRRANQITKKVDLRDVEMAKAEVTNIEKSRSSLNIVWENVGPTNIGGRTRAIIIDKNNPDVMYAGGVSGGLWKSTTAGSSWKQIRYSGDAETNDIPNLAIASMCQAANGDIYFGTGEGHYRGYGTGSRGIAGEGIWKSTDGETFTRLTSTWSDNESKQTFAYVNKLAADPNNANRIFAATARGVRLTEDGGQTWTNPVVINNVELQFMAGDIKISNDGNIVIVSLEGKAFVSKQQGAVGTFNKVSGPASNLIDFAGRLEFSIAPSDGNYIYCQASKIDGSLLNVYRSTDGGDNWSVIGPGGSEQFNPLGTQGTYDNVIAVFPDNKNEILLGGQYSIWHWSSTEGWKVRSFWSFPMNDLLYVHADQHAIVFNPENPDIVFVGSDGGIHRSLNRGITWQTRNKNYEVTQFYGFGFGPQNELIGGTQDNGSLYMDPFQSITGGTPYHYVEVTGGDGGYSEISQINPDILFTTIYFGALYRSIERGAEGSAVSPYSKRLKTAVKPGDQSSGNNFITPIALWEDFNTEADIDIPFVINEHANKTGDTVYVNSITSGAHQYMYILENDYNIGDTVTGKVREPKEARLAVGFNGSVWVDRFPLNSSKTSWHPITNTVGNVETLTWSDDGKHLFVANQTGELFRVSNFENTTIDTLTIDVEDTTGTYVLTTTKIADFGNRHITSIAVDPNNANNVFVTLGNYGNDTYVYYSTEAATTTETNTFSSKQGNLPHMPCYAGLIVWNDSNKVLVGSEFGIWGTANISSSNPSWTNENNGADYIPVYMLRQQTKKNGWIAELDEDSGVRNHGIIWAATHGRGIFRTKAFEGPVGIEEPETTFSNESLNIYPNPATEITNINFNLKSRQNVSIMVYDMRGRMVYSENLDNMSMGEHTHQLSVSTFNKGIYVVKLIAGKSEQVNKIVVE